MALLRVALLAMLLTWVETLPARALLHDAPRVGANEWVEFEGGRARMLAARTVADAGAVLEIELQPGWKTYWSAPGPSGIPPQFDVRESEGVALRRVGYPAPQRLRDAYGDAIGYERAVAFPLDLALADEVAAPMLALDATIGVCAEICVPVTLRFATAFDRSDAMASERIERARLALPRAGLPIDATVEDGRLVFTLPNAASDADVYVHPPEGTSLEAVAVRDGRVRVRTMGEPIDGTWHAIVRTGSGPLSRATEHALRIAQR